MAKDMLVTVKGQLEQQLENKVAALPKDLNKERFIQNALTVLNDTKDLQLCSTQSVVIGLLKGAFLGLDFFRKEAYLIKYGNTANFQTDYKGEKKLAKKYSINPVKDIYAKLVRKGDEFIEEIKDGKQIIQFKPIPFSDEEVVGAFAIVYYKDGSMMYETMSTKEIEDIRNNFSKMKNSIMWVKTPGEAYKKTVLRRLLKNVELDFENSEQDKSFENASDLTFEKEKKQKTKTAFEEEIKKTETIIDGEVIDEETGAIIEEKTVSGETLFPNK